MGGVFRIKPKWRMSQGVSAWILAHLVQEGSKPAPSCGFRTKCAQKVEGVAGRWLRGLWGSKKALPRPLLAGPSRRTLAVGLHGPILASGGSHTPEHQVTTSTSLSLAEPVREGSQPLRTMVESFPSDNWRWRSAVCRPGQASNLGTPLGF
jgi:hypothetical protein